MEKMRESLAYLWAVICGILAQWTVHDYGALIGIALGIGTFWVNRYYKKKSERTQARLATAQARQAAALEKRNQILEQIVRKPDSAATALIVESERLDDADKS
ncbi:TPA: alpha/beta hydrolase [Salmonella enterica]|uniref:Alpha/beta hydrolase n=1 Tax=Salmonella enterica TaxID=28901 RepID=A0A742UI20_SALER|nr:alpha/beta hydrolase [Salmonella enterica]